MWQCSLRSGETDRSGRLAEWCSNFVNVSLSSWFVILLALLVDPNTDGIGEDGVPDDLVW